MNTVVPKCALPSRKTRSIAAVFLLTAVALVLLATYLDANPLNLFSQFHFVVSLAQDMWPPNLQLFWKQRGLATSLSETVSMAFLGTLFGSAIAMVLAFFAARTTSHSPLIRTAVRGLLAVERSAPNFIVLLILLIAVGIGPFAGMLTLTIGSVGMFGKLFADAIEQADNEATESVQSVGSTKLQLIRFAILPQVAPSFIANLFYAFDVNLRAAIPLGIFGAGGIGFQLEVADRLLRYKDVLAYTLFIVVLITGMERLSDLIRRRLMDNQT